MQRIPYIIITPVRDEVKYIEETIKSVVNQTLRPIEWIIVDDGSTDGTGHIVDEYCKKYNWIRKLLIANRGFRSAGKGVIDAFKIGYSNIISQNWLYIVKLDADLKFQACYFEKCFQKFSDNPKLGIGGGDIYNIINGKIKREKNPIFHVRGATKIYRKTCWDKLGGLISMPGWDTLDELQANYNGFKTQTFTDLKILQLKNTGSAYGSWADYVKGGRASYICGYHPLFLLIRSVRRVLEKPYGIATAGLFWGYFTGYISREAQAPGSRLKRYIRKEQLKKITFRETIWK